MSNKEPKVIVVGAGMSGILMGIRLKEAGYKDITILEKGDSVGGTWRENTYPGLHCDVPSVSYCYSFEPNEDWSKLMSSGPEIKAYFQNISNKYGIDKLIRFNTEVANAVYNDGTWQVSTKDGAELTADVLITACGILHHPVIPDFKGRDSFKGKAFHTARWDHSVDLKGKRVGIIGTGSTSVQVAEEVCKEAAKLTIFQRTPQWIFPSPQKEFGAAEKFAMKYIPGYLDLQRKFWNMSLDVFAAAVTHDGWQRKAVSRIVKLNLLQIKDPELRRKMTPDYEPLCKRLVISDTFYDTIQEPNVEVVTEAIDCFEENGIRTKDGRLNEFDVIVYGTGFDTQAYIRPINLTGADGLTLDKYWEGGPKAYRTIARPGFPNLFMLQGPNSPIGNFSVIATAEVQTKYIIKCLELIRTGQAKTMVPTQAATELYDRQLKGAMTSTVWVTGCNSWYIGQDGTPLSWPWDREQFVEWMEEPDLGHYQLEKAAGKKKVPATA